MVVDGSLRLDAAKYEYSNVGVHEEDQHEQSADIVESRKGDDQCSQQCLQPLHAGKAPGYLLIDKLTTRPDCKL